MVKAIEVFLTERTVKMEGAEGDGETVRSRERERWWKRVRERGCPTCMDTQVTPDNYTTYGALNSLPLSLCLSLFLPSRSFSGVSAVYQSLTGPVPLAVMAATWKLYWLPFSRPGGRGTETETKRKREWERKRERTLVHTTAPAPVNSAPVNSAPAPINSAPAPVNGAPVNTVPVNSAPAPVNSVSFNSV